MMDRGFSRTNLCMAVGGLSEAGEWGRHGPDGHRLHVQAGSKKKGASDGHTLTGSLGF